MPEERAALMSRTGKGAVLHIDVAGQRVEERGQQPRFIRLRSRLPARTTPAGAP